MLIEPTVIEQARRMLADGISQRQTALRLGISRGTVAGVFHGRRPDYARRCEEAAIDKPTKPIFSGPHVRCRTCGAMAKMPCKTCADRAALADRPRRPHRRRRLLDPLGFELRPEHQARYEQIHAERLAADAAADPPDPADRAA